MNSIVSYWLNTVDTPLTRLRQNIGAGEITITELQDAKPENWDMETLQAVIAHMNMNMRFVSLNMLFSLQYVRVKKKS